MVITVNEVEKNLDDLAFNFCHNLITNLYSTLAITG